MQKKVIVIGGGFAGLTAAAYLAKEKFNVTILEASPKLGGRAYSFPDKYSNTIIDNGQHILMGCYTETLNFLKLINAVDNFLFQDSLKVNFIKEGFELFPLKSSPVFYPLNLLFGFLNFKAISFKDRLNLLKVFLKIPFISRKKLKDKSISDWLKEENQSAEIQNAFWKILAVGALNTSLEKASAETFVDILKKIFLKGNFSSTIILPKIGLTESYCIKAKEFIEKNGGEIKFSEGVDKFVITNDEIKEIHTSLNIYKDFDFVISAVPSFAVNKFLTVGMVNIPEFSYSSIMNIHVWLKENKVPEGFFGLINSPVHWVFNKGTHLNLVISDANELMKMNDLEIEELIYDELKKFMNINKNEIIRTQIIKEKRATFIPSRDITGNRPQTKTKIKNLFLAGDWVNTGLPSTIESAVKSGRLAAGESFNF